MVTETGAKISSSGSADAAVELRLHWPFDPNHRKWMLAAAGAAALGCALLWQWYVRVDLTTRYHTRTTAIAADEERNSRLATNLSASRDWTDRYSQQRADAIREIGDFEKELELLSRRTKRLERVRDQLEALDATFAQFRQSEKEFESNLNRLETAEGKNVH